MTISKEKYEQLKELAGTQRLAPSTQKKLDHAIHRFKYHFPELNWYGNTPIEPTGAGLTSSEAFLWIRHMIHHLSDWLGKMDEELRKLERDLNDLGEIIQEELAEQLPEIIQEYNLFDLIVTGNNEKIKLATTMTTTAKKDDSVFTYGFRTEYGFIEATKTKTVTNNAANCGKNSSTWLFHSSEKDESNVLDYFLTVANIPVEVNRLWVINQSVNKMDAKKEIYFLEDNQVKKGVFDKGTAATTLKFETLNTNYEPQWIVNVLKRVPNGKNYLHYMTLDYKVYEYDLETGDEKLLYRIPAANQDIFDPISDVVEGKSTIWAITYKGTTNRYLKELNGLCFEPCFDGVEMYDTWETPKKVLFTNDFSGIVPSNMYQNFTDLLNKNNDDSMLSAFILSEKNNEAIYSLNLHELSPRKFDNEIVAENLDKYFKDTIVNDLYTRKSLADYQGYFSYDVTDDIANFTDAPTFLIDDTKINDGAKFILENSQFIDNNNIRKFWQRLKVIAVDTINNRNMRVFERTVEQKITLNGLVKNSFSRWYDSSLPINSEKINTSVTGNKLDYLSLAGSNRIYNAKDFETSFNDTPCQTYIYYGLPIDMKHPLLNQLEKKNVIIEVTKGTNSSNNDNEYEIVIKLTYQDDYAELQFRRLMRFNRNNDNEKYGGRVKASYVSPWAYVYYTVSDDSAGKDYDNNPNQGIDQKFEDIINNLQNQINQLFNEIKNLYDEIQNLLDMINNLQQEINNIKNDITTIKNDIKNMKDDIKNIYNKLDANNDALIKILNNLKNIGVWNQTGDTILDGGIASGKGIAGGNINIFGGTADGSSWIRTNNGKSENDLVGGV